MESDFPKDPNWKPFGNLTWLEAETEKRKEEEYLEKRRELYEQRCTPPREWRCSSIALAFCQHPIAWIRLQRAKSMTHHRVHPNLYVFTTAVHFQARFSNLLEVVPSCSDGSF